jgi:hypothetical protein
MPERADADLSTLHGVSEARSDLYNKLMSGEIPEARANVADRILRGQTYLHGDLRLKFINIVTRYKGGKIESVGQAVSELQAFLTPTKPLAK